MDIYRLILVSVLAIMLGGCNPPAKPPAPVFKFGKGDIVKHKVSNDTGIIIRAFYYNHKYPEDHYTEIHQPYYDVKFGSSTTIGIDTAAGRGFLGDVEHFPPTRFSVERCREWELYSVK